MKKLIVCGLLALAVVMAGTTRMEAKLPPGTYAHFTTPLGNFTIKLFDQDAPKTVANFTGLAEGTRNGPTRRPARRSRSPTMRASSSTG